MEATIRIASEETRPRGGFAGAIGGGTETAAGNTIEVDLRDATGGDVALMLPEVAQAFNGLPFPEAGDPHPFGDREAIVADAFHLRPEESETPESVSQGGTSRLREITSEAELDALPIGSIVLDEDYDGYTRVENGWARGRPSDGKSTHTANRIMTYAPVVLVVEGP
jgi:hypothetical protein